MSTQLPLSGRVALVTGVSRRSGIGAAIAARFLEDGACVLASGWPPEAGELRLEGLEARLGYRAMDLEDPDAPRGLVEAAVERFGRIDIVVANHARSSAQRLAELSVRELDRCWAINARASVLLTKSLAELHSGEPGGRVILFTSGQHIAPMPGELAYAISKGAIHQMTASLADALAERGITVNCVNPGPTDTGYATPADYARIEQMFPLRRWGMPGDAARLVAWLASDAAAWITGQVIDSEGGFRRRGGIG